MMAGITNKGPLGVCAPCSPHGGLSRHFAQRRLADASRARLWALAVLIASAGGLVYLVATSDGLIDYRAARSAPTSPTSTRPGPMCSTASRPRLRSGGCSTRARRRSSAPTTPFYGWHYPPFFLGRRGRARADAVPARADRLAGRDAAALSLGDPRDHRAVYRLPARPKVTRGARRRRLACGSSSPSPIPAVFVNLGHGHNGFLTAALIGFALVTLDTRPVLAGVLFGLLAYKPQFGLMIPLVLVATGRWRTCSPRRVTVAALLSPRRSRSASRSGARSSLRRIHARDRARGRRDRLAQDPERVLVGAHVGRAGRARLRDPGRVTLAVAAALIWLWRSPASFALKAAAL